MHSVLFKLVGVLSRSPVSSRVRRPVLTKMLGADIIPDVSISFFFFSSTPFCNNRIHILFISIGIQLESEQLVKSK